jgi:hypothetical protein
MKKIKIFRYKFYKGGNMWCFCKSHDLQVYTVGFGRTKMGAFLNFIKNVI